MIKKDILNRTEKTELPLNIKYRIEKKGKGFYYPQFKKDGVWEYYNHMEYDQREGNSYPVNECFRTIEEAEEFIDNLIKSEKVEIFYKDNWK